jgi:hypothetical protein
MKRLDGYRMVVMLSVVAVAASSIGCTKKNDAAAPETPAGNPLKGEPGGPPAQSVIRRGAQRQVNQNLLRNIGQYYVLYRTEKGRDPQDLQEFLTYLKSDPNARAAKIPDVLESGWVVMVFTPNMSGHQVLAYEKEAFQEFQNRLVLFADGSVKLMVEPEFQAALKAQ